MRVIRQQRAGGHTTSLVISIPPTGWKARQTDLAAAAFDELARAV